MGTIEELFRDLKRFGWQWQTSRVRRVPLLGRWVPPPQRLHLGMPALYRVQLCAAAGSAPGCAGAVLLDADPNVP